MSTNFTIQAGVPFEQAISVVLPAGRSYWLDVDDFEVLAQVRGGRAQTAELKVDLAQFLTVTLDVDTIRIEWAMTGADTRTLEGRGGFYDMLVTDAGPVDARALPPILSGRIVVNPIVTAAVEESP